MNSKWLPVLLIMGVSVAFAGLASSAKQYFALTTIARTLPAMEPTTGPAIEKALLAAELSDEQERWITQAVRSQYKEARGLHELAVSFLDSWANAARIQIFVWGALFCLFGIALFKVKRA